MIFDAYKLPGIEFGLHGQSSLLPVQFAQILFRRTPAIYSSSVDLLVAVLLENIEHGGGIFEVVHTSLFNALRSKYCRTENLVDCYKPGLPMVMAPKTIGSLVFACVDMFVNG